jgi:hypothetical protein
VFQASKKNIMNSIDIQKMKDLLSVIEQEDKDQKRRFEALTASYLRKPLVEDKESLKTHVILLRRELSEMSQLAVAQSESLVAAYRNLVIFAQINNAENQTVNHLKLVK